MTAPPSVRVVREWRARIEAEYRSAALTQHFSLWLIQAGASPDLIADGLRIVTDELAHAELAHAVYCAAGGDTPPHIDRQALSLNARHRDLELDIARVGIEMFCLGETVAVPLFSHFRSACTEASARAALDRVLVDEVFHRDFGWTLLGWLCDGPWAEPVRALAVRELPEMFARLDDSYGDGAREPQSETADDDRRWGVAPSHEYASILHRTVERDYEPRFARLGIDARAAWEARVQVPASAGTGLANR